MNEIFLCLKVSGIFNETGRTQTYNSARMTALFKAGKKPRLFERTIN